MTGRMTRLWRHFVTDRGEVNRHFSAEDLDRVKRADMVESFIVSSEYLLRFGL